MSKSWSVFKKLHRWPGLIISFILLYYGITGIFMNHRDLFSGLDVSRDIMPDNYDYINWNNAALKGNVIINNDSILVYGNIGIWLTDSSFSKYSSFNAGFPEGIDNRKIFDIHLSSDGNLYAATLSGLYGYDKQMRSWKKFMIDDREDRFTGIDNIGDTVYAINRSFLFKGRSAGTETGFTKIMLPAPPGYDKKVPLFNMIWQIHSGEIFGLPGKLYVDLLGLVTVFLSVTGIIYFFFPGWIRRRVKRKKDPARIARVSRWSLRWHNKVGAWTFILLIILYFTGMFLRPPLLIAIGNARILPLKFSSLDQPNPWHDLLRDILYDADRDILLLSASEAMYRMKPGELKPEPLMSQPPVSVMGITVFENLPGDNYLIGSFSGLFLWNPAESEVLNYITGELHRETGSGRPVGDYKVTGLITDPDGRKYMAEYGTGIQPVHHSSSFPGMPENMLREAGISLWSLCLEFHTGRIFENLTGGFYILIVPLAGIAGITVVISGYMLWRRKYRKQGYGYLPLF